MEPKIEISPENLDNFLRPLVAAELTTATYVAMILDKYKDKSIDEIATDVAQTWGKNLAALQAWHEDYYSQGKK